MKRLHSVKVFIKFFDEHIVVFLHLFSLRCTFLLLNKQWQQKVHMPNTVSFYYTEDSSNRKLAVMTTNELCTDLYLSCETGDFEQVKKICCRSNVEFVSLNQAERNGSTALHVASSFGHRDIVRFLLIEVGVVRHRLNTEGLTAYQVAKDEEVRRLFHRPLLDQMERCSQSFLNERDFQVVQCSSEDIGSNLDIDADGNELDSTGSSDDYYKYIEESNEALDILGMETLQSLRLKYLSRTRLRRIGMYLENLSHRLESTYPPAHSNDIILRQELQVIIDKHVTSQHSQYRKACYLLDEYFALKQVDPLIRLYTMPTPFYSHSDEQGNPLEFTILCNLKLLQARYFQGVAYRGVVTTSQCLQKYKWAWEHGSSIITNKTFWSTSIDCNVARMYLADQVDGNRVNVLLILEFSEPSEMAIRLSAIPESRVQCLSEFEDEQEILVLPHAIFRVVDVEENDCIPRTYTVRLKNLPIRNFSLRRTLKVSVPEIFKLARQEFQYYQKKSEQSE